MAGPAPKRASERQRRNVPEKGEARIGQLRAVKKPTVSKADRESWHPRALKWFQSLQSSGQSDYFQDSDWEYARFIADYLTMWYRSPRAMDGVNILAAMGKLGTTEGDRRQLLRVELEPVVEADVSDQEQATEAYLHVLKGGKGKAV